MAAKAGRLISVKVSGVAVAFTAEATTTTDTKTYKVTNAVKRVWDRAAAITVKDGGTPTAEAYTLNRLKGTVTFANAGTRVITLDGSYLPMSTLALGHDVELSCAATTAE